MLRQCFETNMSVERLAISKSAQPTFSNPLIFTIIRSYHQYQIIARRIVEVKQIRYEVEEPQTTGKNNQLILGA
jgi:hypothetical protein